MSTKKQLVELCHNLVDKRIFGYKNEIDHLRDAIENSDKAKDDDEDSGQSKLSEDLEKNMGYLADAKRSKDYLNLIRLDTKQDTIALGSIVKTNSAIFFIAISLGKVNLDNLDYFIISIQSPIGQHLKGKRKGDSFSYNDSHYKILEVN